MRGKRTGLKSTGIPMYEPSKAKCAEIIQNWAFWRDQGRWNELATTFHRGGRISVTWFSGDFEQFIEQSRRAFEQKKSLVKHHMGVPVVKVTDNRALAETDVTIMGRSELGGELVDNMTCGRFLDRLEERGGQWAIVERICVYEKDRLDAVVPSERFASMMAQTDFSAIPAPYRYLGYRLIASGRRLVPTIFCDGSIETESLYAARTKWLREG